MKYYLIRHAESEGNAGLATDSPASTRLTPKGVRDAEFMRVAKGQLIDSVPSIIVTSSYIRTRQTAAPTIEHYRHHRVLHEEWPVQEWTCLRPSRFDKFDEYGNKLGSTQEERRPFVEEYWDRGEPTYHDGDGAESFEQFFGRVNHFLAKLRATRENAVVFTHGNFMRAVIWNVLFPPTFRTFLREGEEPVPPTALTMKKFRQFAAAVDVPNCSVLTLNLHRLNLDTYDRWAIDHLSS